MLCVPLSLPLLPSIFAVLLKGIISTLTLLPFWGVRIFADCPHVLLCPSPAPGAFPLSPEPEQIVLCQLSLLHRGSLWKPAPSILLGFKCSEHVLAAFRSTVHLVSWPAYKSYLFSLVPRSQRCPVCLTGFSADLGGWTWSPVSSRLVGSSAMSGYVWHGNNR